MIKLIFIRLITKYSGVKIYFLIPNFHLFNLRISFCNLSLLTFFLKELYQILQYFLN